jgi:DNA-binding CsgD family transcriptional regulator
VAVDAAGDSRDRATSRKKSGIGGSQKRTFESEGTTAGNRAGISPISSLNHSAVQELIGASFQALDLLNIGLIVCNASGQMLFANQTAETILQSKDGLKISSDGILCATKDAGSPLREIIQEVANTISGTNGTRDVAVAVGRGPGRRALTLLIRLIDTAVPLTGDANQAAVLIIVTDADVPVPTRESDLRRLYGLTSTESRLAKLLMEGKDLDDCCGEMGITRATVRMHRRNLFSKTGVRRQTQLITLLFKSIGLGPRSRE